MLLLGIDFETTGLDTNECLIIEAGAVVWDSETQAPVAIFNKLIRHDNAPAGYLTPEITAITGITMDMLHDFGEPPQTVLQQLLDFMKSCNWMVAHNGALFDKPMLASNLKRYELPEMPQKPWIDTSTDLPLPDKMTTRKLIHLAAEHEFLNPFAHRAVFDVLTMFKIVAKYELGIVCKLASEPTITVKAVVSYDDRELAKARGYRWDGEKKVWHKSLKQSQLEKESVEATFKVVQMV